MAAEIIEELTQEWMTAAVEDLKSPLSFLRRICINRDEPVTTETIRIETKSRGRYIAPFVKKDGEGIMVPGYTSGGYAVDGPNIRIKRPLTPSAFMFKRRPGGVVFSPSAAQKKGDYSAIILEDLQGMEDMCANAEEYLVAQMLRGVIRYSVADEENFTLTFPRPSANNIDPTVYLDDASPTNAAAAFLMDLETIKEVVNDDGSPEITDCIVGARAATGLRRLVINGALAFDKNRDVNVGSFTFVSKFTDEGALFLGEISGIRFWRYARQAMLIDGTVVDMIRPNYMEFISSSPLSDCVMYYAPIMDIDALEADQFVGRRFSKSWISKDPSARMALVHTRPLPVPRRPGAKVSYQAMDPDNE